MRLRQIAHGLRKAVRFALAIGVLLVTLSATAPAFAQAAHAALAPVATLSLRLGSVKMNVREVIVAVGDIPADSASLIVRTDSAEATTVVIPDGASEVSVPLAIASETATVSAEAVDVDGVVTGASSHDLTIDTVRFIPTYPKVSVGWGGFVLATQTLSVSTSRGVWVKASAGGRPCRLARSTGGAAFKVVTPAVLPYGRTRLSLRVSNAWGVRYLSAPVWALRWRPTVAHAILVDKSDFYLYYAEGFRMHKVYPVAIGTPGTPTHVGQFWLGAPRPASDGYGVLRMALSKRKGTGALSAWGGYYIHGTDAPDSIGTEASHGCVRMYNSGVRSLSRRTRGHLTRVTIRP